MEENKPLESDTDETLGEIEDLFNESESNESEPESKVGEKDVQPTDILKQLKQITGREFSSVEDFNKHYSNLKSFVGKKVEPEQKTPQQEDSKLIQILKNQEKIEFFMEKPEAKEYFNEFVKPLAEGSGVSYQEAWSKVQPMIQVSKEKEQEKIGIDSKSRIKPINNPELKKLEELARRGNPNAQEEYIRKKYANI